MESGVPRPAVIAIVMISLLALGAVGVWTTSSSDTAVPATEGTEIIAPDKLGMLVELKPLGILSSTNFLGHRLYPVRGRIKNISSRTIHRVDVRMTFVDASGRTIHEETHAALNATGAKQLPLAPSAERRFEIPFENLPDTWNYRIPKMEVVKVVYLE